LYNVFRTNTVAATQHYITDGAREGRNPNLFPVDRYIASYGDLIQGIHYNLDEGANHYLYSGRGEGRQVTFDPEAYLNRYADLRAVFGNDLNAATRHYIEFGFSENRTWA
jgi:serralysin